MCHNERGINRSNLFPSAAPEGFFTADISMQPLCVLHCAIMGGMRRTHQLNELCERGRGWAHKHKAIVHHYWKTIMDWIFLKCAIILFYIFFIRFPSPMWIFITLHYRLAQIPVGFSRLLVQVFHLWLSLSVPTPAAPPPHAPHLLPLCYSCVHFVPLKFIELAQTAETQKIREALALCSSQRNGIAPWKSEWGVCVVGGDSEVIDRGNGEHCVLMFLMKEQ